MEDFFRTDDPEHVESSKGIKRIEPFVDHDILYVLYYDDFTNPKQTTDNI